jgi:hypothetical protein
MNIKTFYSFAASGRTTPVTLHHIPQDLEDVHSSFDPREQASLRCNGFV